MLRESVVTKAFRVSVPKYLRSFDGLRKGCVVWFIEPKSRGGRVLSFAKVAFVSRHEKDGSLAIGIENTELDVANLNLQTTFFGAQTCIRFEDYKLQHRRKSTPSEAIDFPKQYHSLKNETLTVSGGGARSSSFFPPIEEEVVDETNESDDSDATFILEDLYEPDSSDTDFSWCDEDSDELSVVEDDVDDAESISSSDFQKIVDTLVGLTTRFEEGATTMAQSFADWYEYYQQFLVDKIAETKQTLVTKLDITQAWFREVDIGLITDAAGVVSDKLNLKEMCEFVAGFDGFGEDTFIFQHQEIIILAFACIGLISLFMLM
jgi:hypothetical protein